MSASIKRSLSFRLRSFKEHTKRFGHQVFGNRNYKKFVIISDSRTGSTLLRNLLNFHPELIVEGEEFKIVKSTSEKIWGKIFGPKLDGIKYVGFKLFYQHPVIGDNEVWEYLIRDKDILIIHLKRRNVLRSLVSKKIGLKTKMWTENIYSGKRLPLEERKIELEIGECEEYFNSISEYQKGINEKFKDHEIIEIFYEDLADNRKRTLQQFEKRFQIQEFSKDSQLKKQNPESLDQLIENYDQLNDHFKNSKWSKYFE
ncbi:hypothetical protein GCM10023115_25450 [Pontixanthobacter gangjinensis]|uniref:Sulfotransferase n=1 Tax=Christiangramia aestuarii TaxID=1028746 RepID=A0A7K1LMN7_9FLAO|nr:hypothetical protein [Christiangramia aestuarii]MUP41780.1 hypothetical protein [Christiangramia aestuarii]